MGYRAISWAFDQEAGSATNKAVLLAIAKHANNEGTCYPSCRTLSRLLGCHERTIRRALADLEKRSLILRKQRRRRDGHRTSDLIVLLVGDELASYGHPVREPPDNHDQRPGQDVRAESVQKNTRLSKDEDSGSNIVDFPRIPKTRIAGSSLRDAIARGFQRSRLVEKRNNRLRLEVLGNLFLPYEGRTVGSVWKTDPDKLLALYLDAIEEFEDRDVQGGYRLTITGRMTAFNPNHCPTPNQLAIACRQAMMERLNAQARASGPKILKISSDVEKTPESQERVGKLVSAFVQRVSIR